MDVGNFSMQPISHKGGFVNHIGRFEFGLIESSPSIL
jgi:hypothetical protein